MKFAFVSTILCIFTSVTLASPAATPVGDEFNLAFIEDTLEERLDSYDLDDLNFFIEKRDTNGLERTIESLLNVVNDSGVIWAILDQVAYYPKRIEFIANATAKLVGGVDLSKVGDLASGLNLDLSDLNVSAIVSAVADSGVVLSLLDGILLDEDYRPVLVKLISRVLKSQKNTFLWLVQDVFKSNKNQKRAESSGLETFIGNIISTALSSTLVADVAKDVLTALNETQFLTYTVKHFLADEGYQNMTAQLVIDVMNTGALRLNGSALNVTAIAQKALSQPQVISGAVGYLLSGQLQLGGLTDGLGKYFDAVKDILKDVEESGTFAELNEYVFSESHTVSTPVLFTGNVVVPKTATFSLGGLGGLGGFVNASKTSSKSSKTSSSSKETESASITLSSNNSDFSYATDDNLNELQSAAEVASILSALSASPASETGEPSSKASSKASSVTSKASSAISSVSEAANSGVDSLSLFLQTYGSDNDNAETTTSTTSRSSSSSRSYRSMVTVTIDESTQTTTGGNGGGLGGLLGLFGSSTSAASNNQRREVSQGSGASIRTVPMFMVYLQLVIFGGVLML